VYGEQWIKFMKDGVNATPLPTVNTTGYIDHAAFLGTINPDTNKIPKHLFQGYLNIYNNYFKARSEERFSRNAETDLVCRLLLEKKQKLTRIGESCVVFLRALANKGAERHSNSHQRMISFEGTGDMQTEVKRKDRSEKGYKQIEMK